MRVVMKTDKQEWIKATTAVEKTMAHAMTATVKQMATETRDGIRQSISAAGFGSHWVNSIKFKMLEKGDVLNPDAWVHSTINFSDVFETGKHIVGNPLLWLPLPAVPPWPGDPTRQMSPRKYIQTVGPLVTIRRPGKTPLLGAIVESRSKRRPGRRLSIQRITSASPHTTRTMVPLFVGVSAVEIEKRFDFSAALSRVNEGAENTLQQKFAGTDTGDSNVQWR